MNEPGIEPLEVPARRRSGGSAPLFHVWVLVTQRDEAERMRDSFVKSGFDATSCRFTFLDNSRGNRYEPFSALNSALASTDSPYLIFCHQDVRLNRGDGRDALMARIQELDALDPLWAVAGNAGGTPLLGRVLRISDPLGVAQSRGPFPHRVLSLDENFLVVRTAAPVRCSPELGGFHLYGTDLCLNAALQGRHCYVLDFHLTHLSAGRLDTQFDEAVSRFEAIWGPRFRLCYVRTTCTTLFLSRHALLRRTLGRPVIRRLLSLAGSAVARVGQGRRWPAQPPR